MSSAIEETVRALVDFESELERAKQEAKDSKKKTAKDAADWAEEARTLAVSKAQAAAADRVARAKEEAGAEAAKIRAKGDSDLRSFEGKIAGRRTKAAALVVSRLLGEPR